MCLGVTKATRLDNFVRPVQLLCTKVHHNTAAQYHFRRQSAIPQTKIVKEITHCSFRVSADFLFSNLAAERKGAKNGT